MSNTFGASNGFGDITGWNLQSVTDPTSSKRATVESKTGNETEAHQYDERQEVTAVYKAKANFAAAAPEVPPEIGAVLNGILLLSISLAPQNKEFITMTLSGHRHTQEGATDGESLRKVAHKITLAKGFGTHIIKYDGTLLTPGGTFESIQSQSCSIECDHDESPDKDGNTNQGENFNPRINISFSAYGQGPLTAPDGFEKLNNSPARNNQGMNMVGINCFKALAFSEA